jgi:FKBP-type peptidyl-prolyl cis-trans isomerase
VRCNPLLWFVVLGLFVGCAQAPAANEGAAAVHALKIPADAERSPSGLTSKVYRPGFGESRPALHDKVRVNFSAWNAKGEVSDSSDKRGGPATFEVTGVIAGWSEALQQMRVGELRRLWLPDALVYPGRPGPPRPVAVFDLELLEIIEGEAPPRAPEDVAAVPVDAETTKSGLAYKFLQKLGGEQRPNAWDRVAIRYTGWSSDGAVVERSRDHEPSIFDLREVMPGWREALPLLAVGDRARLWIPEALASGGRVGEPKGTLVYDVELVSIERRPEPPRAPRQVATAPANASKTRSGLAYQLLRKGDGKVRPRANDRVVVHYSAWTADGKLFDSSVVRGKPARLPVDRLIPGWAEGLQLMTAGDSALFWIPEQLAYQGRAGSPPGALVYEVQLLEIIR